MTENTNEKIVLYPKDLNVLGVGYKIRKYKRDKQKKEFPYLSRKQFREYKENQQDDPRFDGYTKIRRKFRDDGEMILCINDDDFDLYEKRRFFSRTTGYVRTGENLFVAIQRSLAWLLLIPLLLGCLIFGLWKTTPDVLPDIPEWTPVIDENIGTSAESEPSKQTSGIQIQGFWEQSIPAGQTQDITLSVPLKNPEGNPCYFTFEISLKDTGEVLYTSKMVPPGEQIGKIDINRALETGDYAAIVHITTNKLETGQQMNSPELQITLHVV